MLEAKYQAVKAKKTAAVVYLAAGSNLGDRKKHLDQARECLGEYDIVFMQSTPVLETEPLGGPAQGKYLNVIWKVQTVLLPKDLLKVLLAIEKRAGRVRTVKNGPRTLDLDILFYGRQTIQEETLTIPHPRLHEREFILKLMSLIAPDLEHPVIKKTILELFNDLKNENRPDFATT